MQKLFQMKMQKPFLKAIKNPKLSYANGVIFLNLSLRGGTYDQQSTEWAQVCLFPQFNRVRKFGRLRWAQRSSVQRRSHQNACWAHQWPTELSRDQQRCRQNVNWATLLNSFVQQTVAKTRLKWLGISFHSQNYSDLFWCFILSAKKKSK